MKTISKILVILSLIALACQPKNSEGTTEPQESPQVQELRKSVLAVHDEVMPLMSDIYQLKNKLTEKLKDSVNLTDTMKTEIRDAITDLDSANQGMRVWMREFSDVKTAGVPEGDALKDLNAEMEKIKKVKEDMLSSVALAQRLNEK